jgi:hypothetical protein
MLIGLPTITRFLIDRPPEDGHDKIAYTLSENLPQSQRTNETALAFAEAVDYNGGKGKSPRYPWANRGILS